MRGLTKLAWLVWTLLGSAGVVAAPVYYEMTLTVSQGVVTFTHYDGQTYVRQDSNAAGNVYSGYFGVDDAILTSDGTGKPADLLFFYLAIEDNVWAYGAPGNNSFAGFADAQFHYGASSPGFDVLNGEIVGLQGNVHGTGDIPFVDFGVFLPPGAFQALGDDRATQSRDWQYLHADPTGAAPGSMSVSRVSSVPIPVPEPPTLALVTVLMLGYGLSRATIRNCGSLRRR